MARTRPSSEPPAFVRAAPAPGRRSQPLDEQDSRGRSVHFVHFRRIAMTKLAKSPTPMVTVNMCEDSRAACPRGRRARIWPAGGPRAADDQSGAKKMLHAPPSTSPRRIPYAEGSESVTESMTLVNIRADPPSSNSSTSRARKVGGKGFCDLMEEGKVGMPLLACPPDKLRTAFCCPAPRAIWERSEGFCCPAPSEAAGIPFCCPVGSNRALAL
jgi:hypothetical protein